MLMQLTAVFMTFAGDAAPQVIRDIPYWTGEDRHPTKHLLDLYLPGESRNFPVLFFIHGGAWMHGDKNFLGIYSSLGKAFAAKGIGVVVANYRLSPAVRHPEHSRDVARALAWTQKNIASRGGDPSAITLCGHSAGGHLVSLVACSGELQKECGVDPTRIRAVAPISGVYDIPKGFLPGVFGAAAGGPASPARLARAGLPPFLILYGQHDLKYCGKATSDEFCKILGNNGNQAMALELAGADHMFALLQSFQDGKPAMRAILHLAKTGELPANRPTP